ncbi:MAG: hypothetical protein ABL993_04290 [Vicinamibacterales bacterium]
MRSSIRRTLTLGGAVLFVMILLGATYQGVATAIERRRHQYPGRMVKAGNHQLHIFCTGEGAPTVLLEAPATGMSAAWGLVQPIVAMETRVCSYDRAGLGWSEWGQVMFDPAAVPVQLHTLLVNAGERTPYVVAGQGLGAAFARMYAGAYPNETAALILIDPPNSGGEPAQLRQMARMARMSPWLARTGVLRAARALSDGKTDLPEPSAGAVATFLNRPDHLTRAAAELARWSDAVALAAAIQLPEQLAVTSLNAAGRDRTALLTDRAASEQVAKAILDAVDRLRAQTRTR